jgi:peptidoglycan/LPS O-acetylase OafA/YrhL
MNLYSPFFYFALMAIVLGVAWLPWFRFLDAPQDSDTRYQTVDGLRGFLALGVFVFHVVVVHGFIATGRWEAPVDGFYALLGPIGVSVFFMLTGFLFWGKLLRARGRIGWRALYIGRLFRIGPMYLAVVLAMLGVVAWRTDLTWHEPPTVVGAAVLQWLALGMIDTQPDVNGVNASRVLAGVTWTIAYEWAFYASLPLSAVFARGRAHLLFVLAALTLCLAAKSWWKVDAFGFAALFLMGMSVASLLHERIVLRFSDRAASSVALLSVAAIFATSLSGYGTLTGLLLASVFYLVCCGTTLFGLLMATPSQRLGRISYSLYLMQGLVLTLAFAAPPLRVFALDTAGGHWVVASVGACLLVLCAALGYALIEKPGIALGGRLARRVHPWRAERIAIGVVR